MMSARHSAIGWHSMVWMARFQESVLLLDKWLHLCLILEIIDLIECQLPLVGLSI